MGSSLSNMQVVKDRVRTVSYLLSSIALVVGIIYIVVAALTLAHDRRYTLLLNATILNIASGLLVVSGLLCLVLGIFGIVVATESRKRILVVMLLLTAAVFLAIVSGALAYYWRSKCFDELAERHLCDVRMKFGRVDKVTHYIDRSQAELKCCGSTSYYDYVGSYWWWVPKNRTKAVPFSCCVNRNKHPNCNMGVAEAADIMITDSIHTVGCAVLAKKWVSGLVDLLCGIAFGFALLLLLLLLLVAVFVLYELSQKQDPRDEPQSESPETGASDPNHVQPMTALINPDTDNLLPSELSNDQRTREEPLSKSSGKGISKQSNAQPMTVLNNPNPLPIAKEDKVLVPNPIEINLAKTASEKAKGNPRYLVLKPGHNF